MDWTVRQATPDAAPTVHEIARESWHAAYDDFLGPETVDEVLDDWYAIDDLEESIETATDRDDVTFPLAVTKTDDGAAGDDVIGFAHAGAQPEDASVAYLIRLYARPNRWEPASGRPCSSGSKPTFGRCVTDSS